MTDWDVRIQAHDASSFSKRVWKAMLRIPKGKVASYQTIAKWAGSKGASRAVGNACNQNPFAPEVPCHRVVSASGELGGYAKGTDVKIRLLKKEGIVVRGNKIRDFDQVEIK